VLHDYLKDYEWKPGHGDKVGHHLHPESFFFQRNISHHSEGRDHLEKNIINVTPYIVTSERPALTAAQAATQDELDRAFRTIVQKPAYKGKKIPFISGLNVDISPQQDQLFTLTKFIPWATYAQDEHGNNQTWEQAELFEKLKAQSTDNPDEVNLATAIEIMGRVEEIRLPF